MQVTDSAGLGIHFRGDSIRFSAGGVALCLQLQHAMVKFVGTPLPDENWIIHI